MARANLLVVLLAPQLNHLIAYFISLFTTLKVSFINY